MSASLVPLGQAACLSLLAANDIGRIAVVQDGWPLAFPINYRLVELDGAQVIAIRTRVDNDLDHLDQPVGFEIDGVGAGHDGGWSVVVRGHLRAVDPGADVDSFPLVTGDRDAWRVIVPERITGRRVEVDPGRWSFHPAGYL